jgi:hypothetical protein
MCTRAIRLGQMNTWVMSLKHVCFCFKSLCHKPGLDPSITEMLDHQLGAMDIQTATLVQQTTRGEELCKETQIGYAQVAVRPREIQIRPGSALANDGHLVAVGRCVQ